MNHCLVAVLLAVRNIAIKLMPLTYHRLICRQKKSMLFKYFQSFAVEPKTKFFRLGHEMRVDVD
jgi:hypothetical protein